MEIGEYVNEYEKILKELDRRGMARMELAIVFLQEVAKDKRMEEMKKDRERNDDKPATKKQITYLKNLGVEVPEKLTKKEASRLIDDALDNNSR